jgi:hypothetical protein
MHAWQRLRIDLTKLLKNACGILFQMRSMPDRFPLTSLADLADCVTVVPFHLKHAQCVKDKVKLLAMETNQHFAVYLTQQNVDLFPLLAQHMVERCPADM